MPLEAPVMTMTWSWSLFSGYFIFWSPFRFVRTLDTAAGRFLPEPQGIPGKRPLGNGPKEGFQYVVAHVEAVRSVHAAERGALPRALAYGAPARPERKRPGGGSGHRRHAGAVSGGGREACAVR